MTTPEIYKLASELTEQQVLNVISGWENTKYITTYNILLRLGDSMQIACASVIGEKYNEVDNADFYKKAYES
jgi:hypothetical protein